MLQRLPFTPLGLAVLGAVLAAALAIPLVLLWPRAGICPMDDALVLASGRAGRLCEIRAETQPGSGAVWLVLRAVVPGLARGATPGASADHAGLCESLGLPALAGRDPVPARIVVELMGAPFPRGEAAPDDVQRIETYRVADGTCIWEGV